MNILCVADKKGRIQYNRCSVLKRYVDNEHNIDVVALDEKRTKKEYDIVYYSHFSLYNKLKKKGRKATCTSITSHKCVNSFDKTLDELKKFDRVSVNNTYLLNIFGPHVENMYYTPNGVDTKVYKFKDKCLGDSIKLGWVGNGDRKVKNYEEILMKLVWSKLENVIISTVVTSKSDTLKDMVSREKMVEFYQGLDYFLVTSSAEGTPNPALEAMSCGVPVISTKVGNMVEIIVEDLNGFFVKEPSFKSFLEAIKEVKQVDSKKYSEMRKDARKFVESWDWDIKSKAWIRFFIDYD